MTINAALVQELRKVTGVGLMECKAALVKANGNMENAIKILRESGHAKALKKSGRVATEGMVAIRVSEDNKAAFIAEINTETDFAARDQSFIDFVARTMHRGLENQAIDLPSLLDLPVEIGKDLSIVQDCEELVAKIGENIKVRRVAFMTSEGVVGTYCHNNKIGVLVSLSTSDIALGKEIAMHIAASKPVVINPEEIPSALIDEEKEIFSKQAAQSGKPKEIIEKMVAGRIKKFVNEVSLLGQPYIKDPSITVGELLNKSSAQVLAFVRFELGEGVEKEEKDFVKEVIPQASK
jgi:elongation factor Ts